MSARSTRTRPASWWLLAASVAVLLSTNACVYFNTFYNARKYFNEAEKARREEEDSRARIMVLEQAGVHQGLSTETQRLYDQAARRASRVLERYPESGRVDDALFLLGQSFYWQQDYMSAERSFRELEESFPRSRFLERARYWRALSLEAQRNAGAARSLYRSVFDEASAEVGARAGLRLGEMAFSESDYTLAAQEYRAALEAFPRTRYTAILWLRLGEALMESGDSAHHDAALQAFEQALKASPSVDDEFLARLYTAKLLDRQGQAREALKRYRQLLDERRFRVYEGRTRILVGRHYQEQDRPEAALAEYEKVRDHFPNSEASAMALYQTGLLYLRYYGQEERAVAYFKEVSSERRGSEAERLAGDMLRHVDKVSAVRERISRAAAPGPAVQEGQDRDAEWLDVEALDAELLDAELRDPGLDPDRSSAAGADTLAGPDTTLAGRDTPSASDQTVPADAGTPPAQVAADGKPSAEEVLQALLEAAELYRDPDRLAVPDSALHYLQEIRSRFPEFDQMPWVLYSMGWTYLERKQDPEAAQDLFKDLIREYPQSEHANAARRHLGRELQKTATEAAAAFFQDIEAVRLQDPDHLDAYVPLLDSLSHTYAETPYGPRAAFLAAYALENVGGDSAAAATRYAEIPYRFPRSRFAAIVAARDSVQRAGLINNLERDLKTASGPPPPGERITFLSTEPDTVDVMAMARKHHALGLRAYRRENWPRAREELQRSLEERGEQPEVLYLLGNVLGKLGDADEALRCYREALALQPQKRVAQYRLLSAHTQAGQADSANYYLRTLMQTDTRNPQMQRLRDRYSELVDSEGHEGLDLDTLRTLDINPPVDNLNLSGEDILQDLPVVRRPVQPRAPVMLTDTVSVILDVLVDVNGQASRIEVFSGPDFLHEPATTAAQQYRFFPAVDRRGNTVPVWVELPLPFSPVNTSGASGASSPVLKRSDEQDETDVRFHRTPEPDEGSTGAESDSLASKTVE